MTAAAFPVPPAGRVDKMLALDQHVGRRFGMALSAFPAGLVKQLVDALPSAAALVEPAWQERVMRTLSIGETYFLRHPEQFEVLGRLADAAPKDRPLRAWSAACSTGEEAWSIAATLRGRHPSPEVIGSDLNPASIAVARTGIYRPWSTRGLGEVAWLRRLGDGGVEVDGTLRALLRFEPRNLMEDPYPEGQDVIFCRNVLIYFGPDAVQAVYSRLWAALRPGGVLFTSATDPEPGVGVGFLAEWRGQVRVLVRPAAAEAPRPGGLGERARAALGAGGGRAPRPVAAPVPLAEAPPRPGPPRASASGGAAASAHAASEARQAALLRRVGDEGALALLEEALDLLRAEPEDLGLRLAAAELADAAGLPDIAYAQARSAHFLAPEGVWTNALLGRLLRKTGPSSYGDRRIAQARELLQRLPGPSAPVPFAGGRSAAEVDRLLELR